MDLEKRNSICDPDSQATKADLHIAEQRLTAAELLAREAEAARLLALSIGAVWRLLWTAR
jgi:hypothetical protein